MRPLFKIKVFEFLFLIALQVICSPQILVQLFDLHIRNLESVEHLDKHLDAGNDSLRQSIRCQTKTTSTQRSQKLIRHRISKSIFQSLNIP